MQQTSSPPPMPIAEVPVSSPGQTRIAKACEKHWGAHYYNCSGFVRAVATEIDISYPPADWKQANPIIKHISAWETASWWKIGSPEKAGTLAEEGYFVLACLTSEDSKNPKDTNGHVVVVTSGYKPEHHIYPRGYWGTYLSVGKKNATMNWAFEKGDRDKVTYYRCMWKR